MNKKIILSTIAILILVGLILCLVVRNNLTDRFNPTIKFEKSFAKVEKNTQDYKEVQAYNKDGEPLSYKLNFKGFDPNKEYVVIEHKGKYVKAIHYIKEMPFKR